MDGTREEFSSWIFVHPMDCKEVPGSNKKVFRGKSGCFEQALQGLQENQAYPITTRVSYDSSISGWQAHAVARFVGNLSSHMILQSLCLKF